MWKIILSCLVLITSAGATWGADNWYEPARGSAERRAILDSMRPAIEKQLNAPVEFVVRDFRVLGDWAFVQVMPQRPGGKAIDLRRTPLAEHAEYMDGVRSEAILQRRNAKWQLISHEIGATDVWFLDWCQRLPSRLLDDYCR